MSLEKYCGCGSKSCMTESAYAFIIKTLKNLLKNEKEIKKDVDYILSELSKYATKEALDDLKEIVLENKELIQGIIDGQIDLSLIESAFEEKLQEAEESYAPRLTLLENKISKIVYVDFFKNDLETSDHLMFQRAIDYAYENNISNVLTAKNNYYFTGVVDLKNNIHLDLGGAQVEFNNPSNTIFNPQANRQSWRGVFNMWGSENTSTRNNLISYKNNSLNIATKRVNGNESLLGVWGVEDASNFFEGDYVKVWVPYRGQGVDEYFPVTRVMTIVEYVDYDNNLIYTNYKSPFNYEGYSFRTGVDYISKVSPIIGVKISNLKIKDLNPETNRPPLPSPLGSASNTARQKQVCGVGLHYAYNCEVENLIAENLKFSGVMCYIATNYRLENLHVDSPMFVGDGEGYACQNACVANFSIENVTSNGTPRHLVDISTGGYGKVVNCQSFASVTAGFDLHGAGEHDIEFDNCVGTFVTGNSLEHFNDLGCNISVQHCQFKIQRLGYYPNTIINDSEITLLNTSTSYIPDFTMTGGKLHLSHNGTEVFVAKTRGQDIETAITLKDLTLDYVGSQSSLKYLDISGFDHVTIENVKIVKSKGVLNIRFIDSKIFNLLNSFLKDVLLHVQTRSTSSMENIVHTYQNNTYLFTNKFNDTPLQSGFNYIIRLENYNNTKGIIKIDNNNFISQQTTSPKLMQIIKTELSGLENADLDLLFINNTAQSTISNTIGFNWFYVENPSIKITAHSNIRKGNAVIPNINKAFASFDREYRKGLLLKRMEEEIIRYSSDTDNLFFKLLEFKMTASGHKLVEFDWVGSSGQTSTSGKTVLAVRISTMGTSPNPNMVLLETTPFTSKTTIEGNDLILVETEKSETEHKYELYMNVAQYNTIILKKGVETGSLTSFIDIKTTTSELPEGVQYIGTTL